MKKQLEMALAALKKQRNETNEFIADLLEKQEKAAKLRYVERTTSLVELIDQEQCYLAKININISCTAKKLQKFQ